MQILVWHLLIYFFTYISLPFTFICNKSFSCGTFPDSMKIAKEIPIYTGGDKNIFYNYRPISVISRFSKSKEKLFLESVHNFI